MSNQISSVYKYGITGKTTLLTLVVSLHFIMILSPLDNKRSPPHLVSLESSAHPHQSGSRHQMSQAQWHEPEFAQGHQKGKSRHELHSIGGEIRVGQMRCRLLLMNMYFYDLVFFFT